MHDYFPVMKWLEFPYPLEVQNRKSGKEEAASEPRARFSLCPHPTALVFPRRRRVLLVRGSTAPPYPSPAHIVAA